MSLQEIGEDRCPQCNKKCKSILQKEKSARFELSCKHCHFSGWKCYCPTCDSPNLTTDSSLFIDGSPITCSTCNIIFQVVNCPVPDCKKINFFMNETYTLTELIQCKSCKTPFQQLACPHCHVNNYWKGDCESFFKSGKTTNCYSCNGKFQFLLSPCCKSPKYFPNNDYVYGTKQECENCRQTFQHVICVSCDLPNFYESGFFKNGEEQTCVHSHCKQKFKLFVCPDCGKENFSQDSNSNQSAFLKEYNCWCCKSRFSHYTCKQCRESLYINPASDLKTGGNESICSSCHKTNLFLKCNTCTQITVDSLICLSCPPPNLNPINEQTKPTMTQNKEQNRHKPGAKSKDDQSQTNKKHEERKEELIDADQRLCAICFDKKAEIAFVPCGHKKTCKSCSDRIKRDGKPCPFCKKKINSVLLIFE